jgi:two-component system chemotaxis response regulator CheY
MRALVVDDSRAMRAIVARALRKAGAKEITEAADGVEAVAYLEKVEQGGQLPDVALVDWNMPNMNGLELVKTVRRRPAWRRMAIMMVTTENEPGQVVRALAAGAHEYLIKPFDESSLLDKLAILGLQPTLGQPPQPADHLPGGT